MSMPPFQINDREWRALFDEPHHLLKVYAAIRRYMDYETGIAGLHPHHFSEQFFRELLYVEPRPGRSKSVSGSPSKKEIYYSLEALTKIFCRDDLKTPLLIAKKDLGHFVFELPLATTDSSVQKQWGTNGGLMGDAIGNKDKPKKPSKNKKIPEEVEDNGEHNFSDYFAQCGTPPDVRKELPKGSSNSCASTSRFAEFWKAYPLKKGKAEAEKKWKRKKLDRLADQIIEDVRNRQERDKRWIEGYIPYGSTYVHNEVWQDEIEENPAGATTSTPGRAQPQQQKGRTHENYSRPRNRAERCESAWERNVEALNRSLAEEAEAELGGRTVDEAACDLRGEVVRLLPRKNARHG